MASRGKGGRRKGTAVKRRGKATAKKPRAKKPYGRTHHRHKPSARADSKRAGEATRVDEEIDQGAGTRGHRWSRAAEVYVGGMPDRRQSFGRRATDQAPPESFIRQSEGPRGQKSY